VEETNRTTNKIHETLSQRKNGCLSGRITKVLDPVYTLISIIKAKRQVSKQITFKNV